MTAAVADAHPGDYLVFVEDEHVRTVASESEAWKTIRKYPYRMPFEVKNRNGGIREEFLPSR